MAIFNQNNKVLAEENKMLNDQVEKMKTDHEVELAKSRAKGAQNAVVEYKSSKKFTNMLVTLLKLAKVYGYPNAIIDVRIRLIPSFNPTTFKIFKNNANNFLDQTTQELNINLYGDGDREAEEGDQVEDAVAEGAGENLAEKQAENDEASQ